MLAAGRDQLTRSITLLRVFVVASALVLAAGALLLGSHMTGTIRTQAVDDAKANVLQYSDTVVSRYAVHNGRLDVTPAGRAVLMRTVKARKDLLSVKVWTRNGVLAWTNLDPQRIGRHFGVDGDLRETMDENEATGELTRLTPEGEDAVEALIANRDLLEVYAPVHAGRRVVGAYEIYADPAALKATIAEGRRTIWLYVGGVFAALYLILLLLVGGASRLLRDQAERLRERARQLSASYAELEAGALEAIETLNATVEARDPYTGGHSKRVKDMAVAIGVQLGFDEARLASLGHAALLHDVGKVAVPDAVLTKPARLTDEEFDLIRRHPGEGAEIVGRLRRLRPLIPAVRHHHERWDGTGYPDGLSTTAIPEEAAIIGLVDAWDAMTSDRPYRLALDPADALREVVDGRGTQFAPAVVDAFVRALAARPDLFGVDGPLPVALAATAG
jgi:HD-GYP domain-containing protein (c-di-GMP phosphodiesterase class II)